MQSDQSFAQSHLVKHGWEKGKGLGKFENGMKEAIKVKVKNNKGGLGHDFGSEFTFHWWDHIFNKAASSIQVLDNDDGVSLKKSAAAKLNPLLISNKKPYRSSLNGKPLLYGTFVKSGTYNPSLNDDNNKSDDISSNDEEEESEAEDSGEYFGSDTLEKTFLKTGLTGHKAARHGHKMNGKLQRIKEQEGHSS